MRLFFGLNGSGSTKKKLAPLQCSKYIYSPEGDSVKYFTSLLYLITSAERLLERVFLILCFIVMNLWYNLIMFLIFINL